jgi:uncharacterized protein HemX
VDHTTEPTDPTDPTDDTTTGHEPEPTHLRPARRTRNQAGEGVISTAIAVLVVAFIGIGLWRGFDLMVNSASQRTRAQVEQIGR